MVSPQETSDIDLESAIAELIGRIVLDHSRLEFNLGLYLRNAVSGKDPEAANPLISRLSFKSKIDALEELAKHKFTNCPDAYRELAQWLKDMESFRAKRNSFVHGRWGILPMSQEVVNVAPGLPSTVPQKETRYSIEELRTAQAEAALLTKTFSTWSKKWAGR